MTKKVNHDEKSKFLVQPRKKLVREKSDWSLHWSEKLAKGEMLQAGNLGKQINRDNIID